LIPFLIVTKLFPSILPNVIFRAKVFKDIASLWNFAHVWSWDFFLVNFFWIFANKCSWNVVLHVCSRTFCSWLEKFCSCVLLKFLFLKFNSWILGWCMLAFFSNTLCTPIWVLHHYALPITINYFLFFFCFHMVFNNLSLFMSMSNLI
jgi:hypothetical protein